MMRTQPSFFTLALLLLTGACADKSNESATEAADSTSATTQDDSSGTTAADTSATDTPELPTTGGVATAADSTAGDDSGADDSATTTDTTGSDTTGPVDPEIESACQDYCDRWTDCGLQPDAAACIEGCIDSIGPVDGACKAAHQGQLACATGLTCAQLLESFGDGGPCAAEADAITSACQGSEDNCGVGVGVGGDECDLSIDCDGEPLQQVVCDGATCTCLEGGKQVGECEADGICMNTDAFMDKAQACCGF